MAGEMTAEHAVRQALLALPAGWRVLDHVVVGPAGVFVMEALRWSGTVTAHGGELRQDGESRHGVVREAQQVGEEVRRVLPALDPRLVQPVLCFVGSTPGRSRIGGVVVCTAESVVAELLSFPALLDAREVEDLAGALTGRPVESVRASRARASHRSVGRGWLLAGVAAGLVGVVAVVAALLVGPGLGADDDPAGDREQGTHQPADQQRGGPAQTGGHGVG